MNHAPSIGVCARLACVLEASACKFGNVHRFQDFPNLTYRDLLTSAAVISQEMEQAPIRSIGETVLSCIQATRQVVNTNTNLGIVLLLAPLAAASSPLSRLCGRGVGGEGLDATMAQETLTPNPSPAKPGEGDRSKNNDSYWQYVQAETSATTVEDSIMVFKAIRLAKPGGMKQVDDQDVSQEPSKSLIEVMSLAADRDMIARQYANGFADVRAGAEFLGSIKSRRPIHGMDEEWERQIINLQMWFLGRDFDSLILRKRGESEARELHGLARAWYAAAIDQHAKPQAALESWFAAEFPHRNPGTTADLVCASLFVALRTGIIPLPEIPDEYLKEP